MPADLLEKPAQEVKDKTSPAFFPYAPIWDEPILRIPLERSVKQILTDTLAFFDEGKRWAKGIGCKRLPDGREAMCVGIAIQRFAGSGWSASLALMAFAEALHLRDANHIPVWNDDPRRTWADVKAAFCRAIEAA